MTSKMALNAIRSLCAFCCMELLIYIFSPDAISNALLTWTNYISVGLVFILAVLLYVHNRNRDLAVQYAYKTISGWSPDVQRKEAVYVNRVIDILWLKAKITEADVYKRIYDFYRKQDASLGSNLASKLKSPDDTNGDTKI